MEPCLFRHGKLTWWYETGTGYAASMEPCLFRHGKFISFLSASYS